MSCVIVPLLSLLSLQQGHLGLCAAWPISVRPRWFWGCALLNRVGSHKLCALGCIQVTVHTPPSACHISWERQAGHDSPCVQHPVVMWLSLMVMLRRRQSGLSACLPQGTVTGMLLGLMAGPQVFVLSCLFVRCLLLSLSTSWCPATPLSTRQSG